jgi:hypothetical protein
MRVPPKHHLSDHRDLDPSNVKPRRAIGYVRVSTDMQAADGLRDAQGPYALVASTSAAATGGVV